MSSRRSIRLRSLAVIAVFGLVLAACGGGAETDSGVATLESPDDGETLASQEDLLAGGEASDDIERTREEALLAFTACLRENGVDIEDPTVDADGTVWFLVGGPAAGSAEFREAIPDGAGEGLGWLYRVGDGGAEAVADFAAYETESNPDAEQPGNAEPDSNIHGLAATPDGALVADAGGNTLLMVGGDGHGQEARERLRVMEQTNDGFRIAQKDFDLRGPGAIFGTQQHGLSDLQFLAEILRDPALLEQARGAAQRLVAEPGGAERALAILRALPERWKQRLRLAGVG